MGDVKKIIEELEGTEIEKPKGRGRPKKEGSQSTAPTKEPITNISDIAEKIHLLFSIPFIITKKQNPYTPKDFKNEADAIKRLMSKYEILKKAFNFFDPVIILMGFAQKIVYASKQAPKNNTNNEGENPNENYNS